MSTLAIQQNTNCDHTFIVEGKVSSSSSSSFTDSSKNWPVNFAVGKLLSIWSGTGSGQNATVSANTNNEIFTSLPWTVQPDTTSLYRLRVVSTEEYCPKCLGSNSYLDSTFEGGERKTLTNIQQFAQTINTMIVYPLYGSIFNPEIGSGAQLVLSADLDSDDEAEMFVHDNVISSLNSLAIEQSKAIPYLNFDNSELFGQLIGDVVEPSEDDPTILELTVTVSNAGTGQAVVTAPLNTR